MASLADIKTEFYAIVNQPATSTVYPSSASGGTYVENLANDVQDELARSWKWDFLNKKTLFTLADTTNLGSAVATSDTTITVGSTTNFPTSGAVWIDHDVINYTGITSTSLTGVTNIDIAHDSGATVELLYALPTDFAREPVLFVGRSANGTLSPANYLPMDQFDSSREVFKFTVINDKDGTEFLRIFTGISQTAQIAAFHYEKTTATMTTSVNSTIPDPFALKIIPKKMAYKAMITRGDNPENLAKEIKIEAETEITAMRKAWGNRFEGISKTIRNKYQVSGARPIFFHRNRI